MDITALTNLANTIQQREAPGYTEGQYHKSQEQTAEMTTRYGVDMTKFPKNDGESDFDHFSRVYSTNFQSTHEEAAKRLSKIGSDQLLKIIWNTGVSSTPAQALKNADLSNDVGKQKLFANMNNWVGTSVKGTKYWSSGLTIARAKDWNAVAKEYAPDMVISSIKVFEDPKTGRTYRQYMNDKGTVLRTMYSTKKLAPNNKNVVGTTIKIGGK